MDPVIAAIRDALQTSAADLRTAVDGLSGDALDWTPAPKTNSLAVLVAHAATSTRFLVNAGLDGILDRAAYLAADRPAAFATHGVSPEAIGQWLDQLDTVVARLKDAPTPAWSAELTVTGPPMTTTAPTRAFTLVRAMEHLREHVGVAQLMRQLWDAHTA